MMLQRSPHSAILTGTPAKGSIVFHVEKRIGSGDECPIEELTAQAFGAAQLAVEWTGGSCPSGQLVLTKISQ
jgi:hypothetical protein